MSRLAPRPFAGADRLSFLLSTAAYESLYANGLKTDPSNVRSLPLVFIVLATVSTVYSHLACVHVLTRLVFPHPQAVRLSPEHIGGDDRTRRLTSLRYYWSSRRSILIATAIQSESLELVITRLLVRLLNPD